MPSPFPGMNPYLELPVLWAEFHSRLIAAISDVLPPQLQPNVQVTFPEKWTFPEQDY